MIAARPSGTVLLLFAAAVGAQPPQREPVLSQVRVPHGYYWREMYVPQVTSGPASPAWSPDGSQLVYAMSGSLWRQRIGTSEAVQLTDGAVYAHQPDWSPDGKHVVFATYDGTAIDLRVLDLENGATHTLLANGAVNLEPRWSPDGSRLAFVSTAYEGRWHVYIASVRRTAGGLSLDSIFRLTEDRDSGLPRYYYSAFDHYLSPTWSPDGRELILVSNRGRVYGSGGIWRMEARAGAPMRELHFEETTWKARPDWSPDGRRVVYSSYHGRQWNQLWMLSADGGDPLPLTYGEFDATAPRWSPGATQIAFVSNEDGNPALRVVDVPGGKQIRVEPRVRRYLGAHARIVLTVVDSVTGERLPARVAIDGDDGRQYTPANRWRHADEAFVRGERRFEHAYYHHTGPDTIAVAAGRTRIEAWRGPEYHVAHREVRLRDGEIARVTLRLRRLDDLPARGWWGGDLHVHMNYGGAYRNTPERLAIAARAEGLHLVENLIVNKEQRIPDIAYWRPDPDPVSTPTFILAHGQEYHTGFWGHAALLGLRDHYVLPDYAGYPRTAYASLYPANDVPAAIARGQGALFGYVHPFDFRPDLSKTQSGVPWELPISAATGALDYLEVMGYSDHLITSEIWYRLLNCGFRIPAAGGTDAFPNFAALRGPPGLVRTYVHAGPRLTHRAFLDSLRAGRTFVTNAPLVHVSVNGRGPGGEVRLPAHIPERRVRVHVRVRSAVAIDQVELIERGRIVAKIPVAVGRAAVDTMLDVPIERSGWLVLRAYANRPHLPVLDLYPFASTSPIYVTVGDEPVRSREDADYFLRWLERVEGRVRESADWNSPREREAVLQNIGAARAVFEGRR